MANKQATAGRIVILTGAGISAESGIRTFRDTGGLWEDYPIEQVATPEGFQRDPALVHRFYNLRRAQLDQVQPNPAHIALAQLEAHLHKSGGTFTLVTQNVDDLHERAGCQNVIHMHGELKSHLCAACSAQWPSDKDTHAELACPICHRVGAVRPDIVWFGEMPYYMEQIEQAIMVGDLFVSIGTSGAVYPAAGYVQMARHLGLYTLELNLEPSEGSHVFDETRLGLASEIVPEWVNTILGI